MKILRTPESCFDDLPEFPFVPRFVSIPSGTGDALSIHYVDEGPSNGETVLMLHGEPTWSFLYRGLIRRARDLGFRAIAPDLIGFGRSDKPARWEDHDYARQVAWTLAFIDALHLARINLVCHDWGGLIGLRLVAEHPDRFARVVASNTGLPTGDRPAHEELVVWQRFARESPEFFAGKVVQMFTVRTLPRGVVAAYDAPFPDETYKAAARQLPGLVPCRADDPASEANRRAWESLARFDKPFLTVFGDRDPLTRGNERALQRRIPGAAGQPHAVLPGAGHFIQEDADDELAEIVFSFFQGYG